MLGEALSPQARALLTFERGMRAVDGIAAALIDWLEMDERPRRSAREALVRATETHFSWESVADSVVNAAKGRTAVLDPVPGSVPFLVE